MITSKTKLIAVLAISAGLLTSSDAVAKNGGGHGGGNSGSFKSGSNFTAFKMNTNTTGLNNHTNSISSISKKPITLNQTFKKQDFNKDHKNSPLGISLNSTKSDKKFDKFFDKKLDKKFDKNSKDFFCKKDNKCWFDWCYPKNHCYPYYFGCYYPLFSCYDYCTPTYTTCNYTCSSLAVLPNVEPSRTLVSVGSVLLIN